MRLPGFWCEGSCLPGLRRRHPGAYAGPASRPDAGRRRYRPDAVICSDPTVRYYGNDYLNHPTIALPETRLWTRSFRQPAPVHLSRTPGRRLEPHDVKEVYIHGHLTPNHWVDITETIECKIEALKQHKSQVGGWEDLAEGIRAWAKEAGTGQSMAFAESYKRIVLGE